MGVSITDGRRRVLAGQRLNYAVRVRNRSGVAARDARVSVRLPPGLTLLRAGKRSRARTVSLRVKSLGARRVRTLRFIARAGAGNRTLAVTARVRTNGDINPLDDFATDRTLLGRARRPATTSSGAGAPRASTASSDHALALAVARMRTVAGPHVRVPTLTQASRRFGALCRVLLD